MKIWGRVNSSNVRKVLWCAEELNIPYERADAGGAFGIVSDADYLAMNPNGLVPCIEDGGLVLWESNAIVRYLARQYGAAPFCPPDAKTWAGADKWMDWTTFSFAAPYRDLLWNLLRIAPELRDQAAMAKGAAQCARLMAIADKALQASPYLSGQALGIGDIPLGCVAYGWFTLPIERPELPHLSAWYDRLAARPAYRKGVMTPLT